MRAQTDIVLCPFNLFVDGVANIDNTISAMHNYHQTHKLFAKAFFVIQNYNENALAVHVFFASGVEENGVGSLDFHMLL